MAESLLSQFGAVTLVDNGNHVADPGKLAEFREMALSEMAAHDLSAWGFLFEQARRRAGQCRFGRNGSPGVLSFSALLMSLWIPEHQRKTVLHEIAHARTPGHYHDAAWQLECIRVGADPTRTWGHNGEEELEPRWTGTCPAGHTAGRERQPSRQISCDLCSSHFDPRSLFTWTRNY